MDDTSSTEESLLAKLQKDQKDSDNRLLWFRRIAFGALLVVGLSTVTTVSTVVISTVALSTKNDQLAAANALSACRSKLTVALNSTEGEAASALRTYLEDIGNLTVHLASLPPGDPNRAAAFQGDFAKISEAVNDLHAKNALAKTAREQYSRTAELCPANP